MTTTKDDAAVFNVHDFNVAEFDRILAKGLSKGMGDRDSQVCIEAAICQVLQLPHGDDPGCVTNAVRSYKIALNDGPWSTPEARAKGLRDLGLAQLGSRGVVSDEEFATRMAEHTVRVLVPALFREVFPKDEVCLKAADRCEKEGGAAAAAAAATAAAAWAAAWAAEAWAAWAWAAAAATATAAAPATAAWAAATAAAAAAAAAAEAAAATAAAEAWTAWAAAAAAATAAATAWAAAAGDKYLLLSASLALGVLRELNSPGVALL